VSATFWGSLQELSAVCLNVAKICKYPFLRANSGEKLPREAELIAGLRESDIIGLVGRVIIVVRGSGFVDDSRKSGAVGGGGGRRRK
tara:strand:+ start:2632 stop:2892 length:261 start_codon:yes stop_codon:yes gene_type:complete